VLLINELKLAFVSNMRGIGRLPWAA